MQLYRNRPALVRAASCHGVSWLLGSVEVWLALRALGHPVSLGAGLVIESLGQAIRGAAFAVPGGLGRAGGQFRRRMRLVRRTRGGRHRAFAGRTTG
jgi:hypothetical protein